MKKNQLDKAKTEYRRENEIPAELIEGLQRGDSAAFDSLYIHFSKPLFDFLKLLLRDGDEAKNILQDTFLHVFENKANIDFSKNIKGLLYTLSKRRAIDYFRQRKRDERIQSEYRTDGAEPSSEADYIQDEISELIDIAVGTMPQMRRKVFLMRQEGKSNREIAGELGLHESTVSEHLKSAKADLQRMINILSLFVPV